MNKRLTRSRGYVRKKSYETVQFSSFSGDFSFIMSLIFVEGNGMSDWIKFWLNSFGGYSLDPNTWCMKIYVFFFIDIFF